MQDILESKLDKLRKNLLGAPPGRQNVIFVDDGDAQESDRVFIFIPHWDAVNGIPRAGDPGQ